MARNKPLRAYLVSRRNELNPEKGSEDPEVVILSENFASAYRVTQEHYRKLNFGNFKVVGRGPIFTFRATLLKTLRYTFYLKPIMLAR